MSTLLYVWKKHPFGCFFGHECIAHHVVSDPPPPTPPLPGWSYGRDASFLANYFVCLSLIFSHCLNDESDDNDDDDDSFLLSSLFS